MQVKDRENENLSSLYFSKIKVKNIEQLRTGFILRSDSIKILSFFWTWKTAA